MKHLRPQLPDAAARVPPFRVGPWHVRPSLNQVQHEGPVIKLEPRVMHVLVCLASRPNEVVAREELLAAVWSGVEVYDEAITGAISALRSAFGDDARHPRFIETIRKGGYRLIAPVSTGAEEPAAPPLATRQGRRGLRGWLAVWAGAATVAAGALAAWIILQGTDHAPPCHCIPFTSFPGDERYPAVSPDGARVAFSWNGDIYIKQRNSDTPFRLTRHPAPESFPAWSPDGTAVAFVRMAARWGIYTVPAIGGTAQLVLETEPGVYGLDWSPDGNWLAFSGPHTAGHAASIVLVSLESKVPQQLTSPEPPYTCDFGPAFSPDGHTVAFTRVGPRYQQDIYLVPVEGGPARRLTHYQRQVTGFDWTPDGRKIVFAAAPTAEYSLWRVGVKDGLVTWVPTQGGVAVWPSLARHAQCLVYEEHRYEYDIWRIRLEDRRDPVLERQPLVASTRLDYSPRYSPDGSQIAFISTRSGNREVWICDRDGDRARCVTTLEGTYVLNPRWSPDGRRLAFSAVRGDHAAAFVMDVTDAAPRRVRDIPAHDIVSGWSRDGSWLYIESNAGNQWRVWRIRPDGSEAVALTTVDRSLLGESPDGYLYWSRSGTAGIWRRTLVAGEEECVVDPDVAADWGAMALAADGIYFVQRNPPQSRLCFYDIDDASVQILTPVPGGSRHLAVAPDGMSVLYERARNQGVDIMMIEDFR